jgi:hypothetical protein
MNKHDKLEEEQDQLQAVQGCSLSRKCSRKSRIGIGGAG